jgi:transposase
MARPLSNDLRERVVAAVGEGASCRVVASRFGVAVSSVVKWAQRARKTGSVAPGKMGGHRRPILEPHREVILARLKERPETTLVEMREMLVVDCGVRVSLDTIWRFLRAERQTYKKACWRARPSALTWPATGRAGSATRRASIRGGWSSSTIRRTARTQRDLDADQHGRAARLGAAGRAGAGTG